MNFSKFLGTSFFTEHLFFKEKDLQQTYETLRFKITSFLELRLHGGMHINEESWQKALRTCFFLSVRKLKNQPSNKLLLAFFFIQTVKEGNIRE